MRDSTNYNWLKYILIPVFALLFLQVGRPMPLWGYVNTKDLYFDLMDLEFKFFKIPFKIAFNPSWSKEELILS